MKWIMVGPLFCLVAAGVLLAKPPHWSAEEIKRIQHSASYAFKPAEYRGIRMGASRREDVLRVFGEPKTEALGEEQSLYMSYKDIGIVKGRVDVIVDPKSKVVLGLQIYPEKSTLEEVLQLLGPGGVETRWSWATCDEKGLEEFIPVFIDPSGELIGIEYRHLGIYIRPLENGKVDYISYSSSPAGLDADPCPKAKPQRRKQ